MKLLIACDSFKDALPAEQVGAAIARGLRRADPGISCRLLPLADGGEGTARLLTTHTGGHWKTLQVSDPLFRPVTAGYGLSADGRTAFIDLASASGLECLLPKERNPLLTTTTGTGQLLADAIESGVEKIVLGIGGSATNDGGTGMAVALGYEFLDARGHPLAGTGADLSKIVTIRRPKREFPEIEVLCDVDNPLFGPEGAAFVYAPQKGAGEQQTGQLDRGLRHLAEVCEAQLDTSFADVPGAGAAGGAGFGALTFLNARLRSGVEAMLEYFGFEEALAATDLVITGEGRLDRQSLHGKLIGGVCRTCRQSGMPVIAFCGSLEVGPEEMTSLGLSAAFSIIDRPMSLPEALSRTEELLEKAGFGLGKMLGLYHSG